MNLWQQRFDVLTKQAFGHDARLTGTIGTVAQPGRLEIHIGRQTVASGPTFQAALTAASRQLASITRAVAPVITFVLVALL